MATLAHELEHYQLPARIRSKKAPRDSITHRLTLADRIAELPGILVREQAGNSLPCRVDIFMQSPRTSIRKLIEPLRLCSISADGIQIFGLSAWDRHQVLRGGWGRLLGESVLMYLPRDSEELDVCWDVFQRAYNNRTEMSSRLLRGRKLSPWDLPRFSRTTLQ